MKMRIWATRVLLLGMGLLLVACGGGPTPTPPAATNTPLPPAPVETQTEAPALPTATPLPPPTEVPAPAAAGVTARQVQQLIAEEFNTADRNLTLWNIQPGLGTVMIEYGRRIALLHQAVQADDWGMAQYQLTEATEIQEVGETTRPANADLLKSFEGSYLDPLAQDILDKDKTAFNDDFAKAIEGCNACHQATEHPYVVVQPPATSPEDFLKLGSSEPEAPEEEQPAAAPTPAPDQPLTWAELYHMVDDAFNTADRQLALWNIQPGLGTVMMEYGRRMALLKQAVDAEDWGMAQYQLKEATEIQEVGETTRPDKADLLKNFEHTYLDPLAQDILDKNKTAFDADYSQALDGCNACHQGTGHPYVRFQMPPTSPEPFLKLGASEPEAPEEENPAAATPASFPAGNPTLEDARKLIEDRLNTLDRGLALWNIQPGLGTVMQEYGYRFALAWYAGQAGNWGMAAYQLKEATEIQEVGETTRPANADLLKSFEGSYLEPLIHAVDAQDKGAFESGYKAAIEGCNACHQATGHPYVVVQMPPEIPADFLKLGEAVQAPVVEEEQPATSQPSSAASFDAAAAFASKCAFCHGPDGSGGVPNPNSVDGVIPALNTAEVTQEFDTAAKIKAIILDGSEPAKAAEAPGAPINMPSFKGQLSEAELDALVAYVQGLSKK
jgi:mono/diheme cytochrome c family protein